MLKYFFCLTFITNIFAMEEMIEDNQPKVRFLDEVPQQKPIEDFSQREQIKKMELKITKMEGEIKALKENIHVLMGETGRWRTLLRADKPLQISLLTAVVFGVYRGDIVGAIYAGTIIYGALGALFRSSSVIQYTLSKNG